MKKLFLILLSLGLAIGASAQKYYHGTHYYSHPRVVIVGGGFSPYYPLYGFGYPYLGYPYGMPPYSDYYGTRPSKLQMQIDDIRRDYSDKISSARHNKTLSREERKETIRELKHERDATIDDLKNNYYKTK